MSRVPTFDDDIGPEALDGEYISIRDLFQTAIEIIDGRL